MSFERPVFEYAKQVQSACIKNDQIPPEEYGKYHVQRGLRDINGNGVPVGLTNISSITASRMENGVRIPDHGQLYYRGYNIIDLVRRYSTSRFGYEKLAYLLMFGDLPDEQQTSDFLDALAQSRHLPQNFVRDVIMKAPGEDVMNTMTRSILTLASYDPYALRTDLPNVIRQSLMLISVFPMLAIYGYHSYNHYDNLDSMYIHRPYPELSTAENTLQMLRPDRSYTALEASVLDAAFMLHMEHGGGNNSTFTTHVVTSAGSDTYATIAAAMSSLKGPKHGGANLKVIDMMADIRKNVKDPTDDEELAAYLNTILAGEAFDHKGLIYGIGHAIYSVSDPRERVFKSFVKRLSEEKGRGDDMVLYEAVERIAPEVIRKKRRMYKGVSANVDFYSGFVYEMLGIPKELYTPFFSIARIAGWSAHRLEELVSANKIIRPAYPSIMEKRSLEDFDERSAHNLD